MKVPPNKIPLQILPIRQPATMKSISYQVLIRHAAEQNLKDMGFFAKIACPFRLSHGLALVTVNQLRNLGRGCRYQKLLPFEILAPAITNLSLQYFDGHINM
jgi:hypothetical protein